MTRDDGVDPIAIDVGALARRAVASLRSHLVTRPTGRAVRLAIETVLAGAGERTLSVIDLSDVSILDFSCADEVVAQLVDASLRSAPGETFLLFRGVDERHRGPIEAVLERRALAAVVATAEGRVELLGVRTPEEDAVWSAVEERGHVASAELMAGAREACERLAVRRLVFTDPASGGYRALSRLVGRGG